MKSPVQAATQHLANQGATFEGRSSVLKRRQDLTSDQAIERAQKGHPVEVKIGDKTFAVKDQSDLLELDFFAAQGKGEGLEHLSLARTLRDLKTHEIVVPGIQPARVPMEAYEILSGQKKGSVQTVKGFQGMPANVDRDQVQALGLFMQNIGQVSELAHPERAQSLLKLADAKLLSGTNPADELYLDGSNGVGLIYSGYLGEGRLPIERLDHSENIEHTLKALAQVETLRQQYLPEAKSLSSQMHGPAWAGKMDVKQCEALFEHFAQLPKGEEHLSELLRLVPEDSLPNSGQLAQYQELRAQLPESSIDAQEFQWLTGDPAKFDERLQLFAESKKLRAHDPTWESSGLSQTQPLEGNPKRLEFVQSLHNIHPLNADTYGLACSLESEDHKRFANIFEQFHSLASEQETSEHDKASDLARLWSEVGPSFEDNQAKLLKMGLDPARALMASAALGDQPSPRMLEMAGKLERNGPGYWSNDYTVALKCALRMDPEQQKTFQQTFQGADLKNWSATWRNLHTDGKIDPTLQEIKESLGEGPETSWILNDIRDSGVDSATALKNLKETPAEKALRGQRWMAYTARGLEASSVRAAGRALSNHIRTEKNVQELRELDRWFISPVEYLDKEDQQARIRQSQAIQHQKASAQDAVWDQRMAGLQSGSIPWGEPPIAL